MNIRFESVEKIEQWAGKRREPLIDITSAQYPANVLVKKGGELRGILHMDSKPVGDGQKLSR